MDVEGQPRSEFEAEVRTYARATAKRAALHRQDYPDAEQAACLAAWRNLNSPTKSNRRAFLMRCCRNAVIDMARSGRRRREYEHLPLMDHAGLDAEAPAKLNALVDVSLALDELEEDERLTIEMLVDGHCLRTIRAQLQMTEDRFKTLWDGLRQVIVDQLGVVPDPSQSQLPFWRQS